MTDGRHDPQGEPHPVRPVPGAGELLRPGGAGRLLRSDREGGLLPPRSDAVGLPLLKADATAGKAVVAAAGAERAWEAHQARLHAFVSRRVASPHDAQDIVQEVFLRLHRSLPSLREADRIGGWLYQTARNAIVDHYRAPARRREVLSGDARDMEAAGGSVAPEDDGGSSERGDAARCLRPMIERLPESYRRAIDLVELQGMSQAAAARVEGLSLPGMKSRVQRARRRLEAALLACCRFLFDARGAVRSCAARRPRGASCRRRPTPLVGIS